MLNIGIAEEIITPPRGVGLAGYFNKRPNIGVYDQIKVRAILFELDGVTSGIVCDGAKSSCAAKIATAVETGIFGYEMYRNGQQFYAGDGLVVKGVENSIANFGLLARIGMRGTYEVIIRLMTEESENR